MSLEQALEKNTAALQKLTDLLEHQGLPGFVKEQKKSENTKVLDVTPISSTTEDAAPAEAPKERKKRGPNKAKDTAEAAKPASDTATFDRIAEIITILVDNDDRIPEVKAILEKYKVERASQLKPEQLEPALQDFEAALLKDGVTQSFV